MATNASASDKNEPTIKVGESIPIDGSPNPGDKPGDVPSNGGKPAGSDGAIPPIGNASRKRRIGSRIAQIADRLARGTASDSDKTEYAEWEAKRDARENARGREAPPKVEQPAPEETKEEPKANWRKKYGDYDGRELLCASLGELCHGITMRASEYIADNGGKPLIDGRNEDTSKKWFGICVLAWDEILPKHVTAAPKFVFLVGTGALTGQAVLTASNKKGKSPEKKPTPAEETRKADAAKEPEAEPERAGKPGDAKEAKPTTSKKERPKDKDGNPIV